MGKIENISSSAHFSRADAKLCLSSQLYSYVLHDHQGPFAGKSVIEFLKIHLEQFDAESWPLRLALGGLYFNGLRLEQDRPLTFPCKIEYYDPRFDLINPELAFPQISKENIVYRDRGVIALFKPSGLPSMPAKDQKLFNLRDQLKVLLGETSDLHLPSRIDTSVSGLIMISEDRAIHNKLQQLFAEQRIQKEYLALVSPAPDWSEREIDLPIGRSKEWGVLRAIDYENGKKSLTLVKKVRDLPEDNRSLLQVWPKSGRTHQIRLHLAANQCPIVGDRFYAGARAEDLCLLSNSVVFMHPADKKLVHVELPQKFKPEWAKT